LRPQRSARGEPRSPAGLKRLGIRCGVRDPAVVN
jgi:hypothetical protein